MSWDMRRLANAIENAALVIAGTWLLLHGWTWVALGLWGMSIVNDITFAINWAAKGAPTK